MALSGKMRHISIAKNFLIGSLPARNIAPERKFAGDV
jgi:hypothetical protein